MIYCTPCAKEHGWPVKENRIHGLGRCEHCKGWGKPLSFTPNEQLIKDFVGKTDDRHRRQPPK